MGERQKAYPWGKVQDRAVPREHPYGPYIPQRQLPALKACSHCISWLLGFEQQGKVRLGARKRLFTRGWWAWSRLLRAAGMAPSCRSSRGIGKMLSDIGFGF